MLHATVLEAGDTSAAASAATEADTEAAECLCLQLQRSTRRLTKLRRPSVHLLMAALLLTTPQFRWNTHPLHLTCFSVMSCDAYKMQISVAWEPISLLLWNFDRAFFHQIYTGTQISCRHRSPVVSKALPVNIPCTTMPLWLLLGCGLAQPAHNHQDQAC